MESSGCISLGVGAQQLGLLSLKSKLELANFFINCNSVCSMMRNKGGLFRLFNCVLISVSQCYVVKMCSILIENTYACLYKHGMHLKCELCLY